MTQEEFVTEVQDEQKNGKDINDYNASYEFIGKVVDELNTINPPQYNFDHLQLLYLCAVKPTNYNTFKDIKKLIVGLNLNNSLNDALDGIKGKERPFGIVGNDGDVCDNGVSNELIAKLVKFFINVKSIGDLENFTEEFKDDFNKISNFGIAKYTGILHCLCPDVFPFMRGPFGDAYKAYFGDFLRDHRFESYPEYIRKIRNSFNGSFAVVQYVAEQIDSENKKDENKNGKGDNIASSDDESSSDESSQGTPHLPHNLIVFGAPGTGKSYAVEEARKKYFGDSFKRVTFYPTYSYAKFVGTYKPVGGGSNISYEFVPGPFLECYVKAMKMRAGQNNVEENSEKAETDKGDDKVLLIIEEINRAEAAAVFGDMFQLLDRGNDGESVYKIDAPSDVKKYLKDCLGDDLDKIKLPSNMYIWATMNSADQGVYPLDTAFKRRWEFAYAGIDDKKFELSFVKNKLDFGFDWDIVREVINDYLSEELNINEDKLMGPYFLGEETVETFLYKVVMYLFEDAARMYRKKLFRDGEYNERTYNSNRYGVICRNFTEVNGIERLRIFNDDIFNEIFNKYVAQPAQANGQAAQEAQQNEQTAGDEESDPQ